MSDKITVTFQPGVCADMTPSEQTELEREVAELCKDYDVPTEQVVSSGNGPFESDLIKLLKSYGFKATMDASEVFDELKAIG